ncbi:N-ethylammeline chlorohydrolase [Kaistia sp. 32K]|uniref:amidohydrolase family protein n=1 Tax=Kaistia sp. 32K TaxID=2795690 RepID=UPI001914E994|nr:amidohydrolase family protein [Kaistia sp. 32K]BCP53500.1 N-ethylammeline chlorohydrolase [Kaistia sp. 32K]
MTDTTERAPVEADTIIRHGYVITMDDESRIFEDGAVAIRDGRILAVGADAEVAARYRARRVIEARGAPVHPGFVECHLHASFQIFRGALPDQLSEGDAFDTFESVFFNTVNDEEEYLSVLLACMEMVRNGTTCFLEAGTVLEPAMAARAAEQVGIRAILGDAFIWDQPQGFAQGMLETHEAGCPACAAQARVRTELARAPKTREEALERMGGELARNADPDALVTGHVAILGLGTASETLMMEAKARADAAGVVLNLHQSYSPADTAADRERFGKDPLLHLHDIGFLDRNVTFGHANHLTDAECDALLDRGTSIAWAPAASMMWGHGGCFDGRHAELWRRGANIALGSDSANWSNDFDLWRQASLAVLTAREAHGDRGYLIAEDGLYMATRGGARAAGMEERIGSLEAGKRADIVIHTLDRPEMIPVTNMIRNLFYASRSKSVHTVLIDGKTILENGAFVALDERLLLTEINKAAQSLLARMGHAVVANALPRMERRG